MLWIVFLSLTTFSNTVSLSFTISTSSSIAIIPDEYLSVNIDAWLANAWNSFGWNSNLVNTLAKGLVPAYLRYGGTNGDNTWYNMSTSTAPHIPSPLQYINQQQFFQLANFVDNIGWKFVFGLDAQIRNADGSWDDVNTKALMRMIADYKYIKSDFVYSFELGNEPDIYNDFVSTYNFEIVNASQLAYDYIYLNKSMDSLYHNGTLSNLADTKIWGIGVTPSGVNNNGYLQQYLETLSSNTHILDKITWHHYYGDGSTWTVTDFVNVDTLDTFIDIANNTIDLVNKYGNGVPLILGETGSCWNGWENPLAGSFVAGFMWLDKLGLSAGIGMQLICRQKFWSGYDSLIENNNFYPNPDYWSSYIFKALIGNKVLMVDNQFNKGRSVRVYAFCARNIGSKIINYPKGSVTALILNLQNDTISITLNMEQLNDNKNNMATMSYDEYLLSSNNLSSTDIYLNGQPIKMVNDNALPTIKASNQPFGSDIVMQPVSYGFVVIVNASAQACLS